ncbi:hypothetical protein D9611_013083 [Ephemerocybe angulata]|uniref:Uncharacterized protein n=1 Tax=Ephemerocybe angulata TaxID=980116 RepID=A0A8H5BX87_9AGAR|nr:hypothetical protein D9611_013083 [Tulosesus angulatus]
MSTKEKNEHDGSITVQARDVDTAAMVAEDTPEELSPEDAERLSQGAHLSQDQFNWLATILYITILSLEIWLGCAVAASSGLSRLVFSTSRVHGSCPGNGWFPGVVFTYSFLFPDSPTTARFLTPEERAQTVQRIKVNQSGVENKRWKREQFIEALKDPKVWVMAGFGFLSHVPVSMTFQKQIIVSQLGFNALQTTLLSCADGVVSSALH